MSDFKNTIFGDIPLSWNITPADKYCIKVTDGTHDSPKESVVGFPLVTSRHIKGNEIDFDNTYLISEEDYNNINKRSYVSQWDVIISMIGEYCGFTYLEENSTINYAIKNVGLFKTNDEIDSKWLYYFFQSKSTNHILSTYRSGTSQPYLSLGTLRKFPIITPQNNKEKKEIVLILDSLRNKINLLQAQNQTLEATAQTIFKEWFGKYQIGDELPEGWRVGKITELFEVRDGTHDSPKQKDYGKKLITSKHLSSYSIEFGEAYFISEEDYNQINMRSKVESYDILFSMIGTIGLTYLEQNTDIDYAIKNVALFKTSQNKDWAVYTYLWLTSFLGKHFISTNKSGSTQEYVSLTSLRNIDFNIPNNITMKRFNNIVFSIFEKIHTNAQQIQTLQQTRDTLLPKLMSGKLRVDEFKE